MHQARLAAQKVFSAKLEGRDPAAEKHEAKRRAVADRVEDLLESFITHRLAQIAPPVKPLDCSDARWEFRGLVRAFTPSASAM